MELVDKSVFRLPIPRQAGLALWPIGIALAVLWLPGISQAQERRAPDVYEATTTDMSPAGITLRINVLEWSDENAREDVIAALTGESDVSAALVELPSAGVVWRSGSAVGHALKYAHRVTAENGQETITFVTEKPLDSFSFKPWAVADATEVPELDYTVIELRVDESGSGSGTLSLAADVEIDSVSATVSLSTKDGAPTLLTDARLLPKPYWARED